MIMVIIEMRDDVVIYAYSVQKVRRTAYESRLTQVDAVRCRRYCGVVALAAMCGNHFGRILVINKNSEKEGFHWLNCG